MNTPSHLSALPLDFYILAPRKHEEIDATIYEITSDTSQHFQIVGALKMEKE